MAAPRIDAIIAAAAILATTGLARADLITIGALKDNTLIEDPTGSVSNGAGDNFFVGRTNQSGNSLRRGLIAFDVAAFVPGGAVISSVSLTLHLSSANEADQDIALHRALADWGEGTSIGPGSGSQGGAATAGDATWLNTFFPDGQWAAAGGDFAAAASAVTSVGAVSAEPALNFYEWSGAGMVDDVQGWLDDPSSSFGWLLLGNESAPGTSKRFDTREDMVDAFRPTLTIEYAVVPAPAAAPLLAALALGRRRRRGTKARRHGGG